MIIVDILFIFFGKIYMNIIFLREMDKVLVIVIFIEIKVI